MPHLYLLLYFELHAETSYSVMIANVVSCNVVTFGCQPLCVSVASSRVTLGKSAMLRSFYPVPKPP